MPELLKLILIGLMFLWLWFALLASVYMSFDDALFDRLSREHETFLSAILFTAFFESIWIIGTGIQPMLLFIPESWGNYSDGEWVTLREVLAFTFGLLLTMFICSIQSRYRNYKDLYEDLKRKQREIG